MTHERPLIFEFLAFKLAKTSIIQTEDALVEYYRDFTPSISMVQSANPSEYCCSRKALVTLNDLDAQNEQDATTEPFEKIHNICCPIGE